MSEGHHQQPAPLPCARVHQSQSSCYNMQQDFSRPKIPCKWVMSLQLVADICEDVLCNNSCHVVSCDWLGIVLTVFTHDHFGMNLFSVLWLLCQKSISIHNLHKGHMLTGKKGAQYHHSCVWEPKLWVGECTANVWHCRDSYYCVGGTAASGYSAACD